MRIKAKLYPYPVLAPLFNNDYKDSNFRIEVNSTCFQNEYSFKFVPLLENIGLKNLVESEQAKFAVHIESTLTSYRKLLQFGFEGASYSIPADDVEKTIEFTFYLIATTDIPNYSNENFNDDYGDVKFDIEKGNVLAVAPSAILPIEKLSDDMANIPSIFSVTAILGDDRKEVVIDNVSYEKINIQLPEKQHMEFKILMNNPCALSVIHSMIIIPALMKCLEDLKISDFYMLYSERRWVRVIKKALIKHGYSFEDVITSNLNSFELAQKIMDNTICRGITDIQSFANVEEEAE